MSFLQPLDLVVFGVLKNQYSSWLMSKMLEIGPENLNMETCIRSLAEIFEKLDIKVINNGFKKTELPQFKTAEVIEPPELSRAEQIMNICFRNYETSCFRNSPVILIASNLKYFNYLLFLDYFLLQ